MAAPSITSLLLKRLNNVGQFRIRQLNTIPEQNISKTTSTKPAFTLIPAQETEVDANNARMTKRRGSVRKNLNRIPPTLQNAVSVVLDKYPVTDLVKYSENLRDFLKERKHKPTQREFDLLVDKQIKEMKRQDELVGNLGYDEQYERTLEKKAIRKSESFYDWFPMRYSGAKVIQYLAARICGDYSAIYSCLREIKLRDKNFYPNSILDFGSGLATSVWATNELWRILEEYYCVDYSNDMNIVARLLLQDGIENGNMRVPVIFRNTLPSDHKSDIVVCTYTLMEMENEHERSKLVESLWNMTENYLVIVEKSGHSGFTLIHEARQQLLKLSKQSKEGHIFSPCPHHEPCPKLKEKNAPCYFEVKYNDLVQMESELPETEYFSYIIFKVGPKTDTENFPRIVDEPFKIKQCTHCHLCCSDGSLHHAVISAQQHGKFLYKSSRSLLWGDMFPATVKHLSEDEEVISEDS